MFNSNININSNSYSTWESVKAWTDFQLEFGFSVTHQIINYKSGQQSFSEFRPIQWDSTEPVESPVNAGVGTGFRLQFTTLAFPNELQHFCVVNRSLAADVLCICLVLGTKIPITRH